MNRQIYTHESQPNPNFFIGIVQLLFWMVFHPSAWASFVKRLDPTLQENFCLAKLNANQWKNPSIRRLILQTAVWMPSLGCLTGLAVCLLMGVSPQLLPVHAAYGMGFGWAAALLTAYFISPAVAMTYATALSFTTTISNPFNPNSTVLPILLSAGFAGIAILAIYPIYSLPKFTLTLGNALGITTSVLALFLVAFLFTQNYFEGNLSNIQEIRSINMVVFWVVLLPLVTGWIFCLVFVVLIRSRNKVRDLTWLVGLFILMVVINVIAFAIPRNDFFFYLLRGGIAGLLISTLVLFLWTIFLLIGGPHTAALGAIFGGGIAWVPLADLVILRFEVERDYLMVGLLAALLITLQPYWRPLLFHFPFSLWNRMLLVIDEQKKQKNQWAFPLHAAFWDEHQYIGWAGLDAHLLLVAENDLASAEKAFAFLMQTRQRWAVRNVQIELDALELEACQDIHQIRLAHRQWEGRNLSGPAAGVFGTFIKTSQEVEKALSQSNSIQGRSILDHACDLLSRLEQDVILSADKSVRRFLPIAAEWQRIIFQYQSEWEERVALNVELDNPYICGIPLNETQQVFVGRVDLMKRIERLLFDSHPPALLLYGQRRMGKTSLLLNLGRILPRSIVPMFIDLQGVGGVENLAAMIHDMVLQMRRSAERQRSLVLPLLTREELLEDESPIERLNLWFDELEMQFSAHQLTGLIMLDEFEMLDQFLTVDNPIAQALLSTLRHVLQHRRLFRVVLAGSHTLDEFNKWAAYLVNVQVVKVGYLDPTETVKLITNPVHNFQLHYDPAAIQLILNLTRGHPNLVQLVGYELVIYKNEQPIAHRFLAKPEDIEKIIPQVMESGSIFFADIENNQISPLGANFLRRMADEQHRGFCSLEELSQFRGSAGMESCFHNLLQRDIIEPCPGGYCFQVDLVKRWFGRSI